MLEDNSSSYQTKLEAPSQRDLTVLQNNVGIIVI